MGRRESREKGVRKRKGGVGVEEERGASFFLALPYSGIGACSQSNLGEGARVTANISYWDFYKSQ